VQISETQARVREKMRMELWTDPTEVRSLGPLFCLLDIVQEIAGVSCAVERAFERRGHDESTGKGASDTGIYTGYGVDQDKRGMLRRPRGPITSSATSFLYAACFENHPISQIDIHRSRVHRYPGTSSSGG
jgi:hypothetical protein